jgi:uncharacterized Zn-binding protein involved in type VI secretion
MRRWMTPLIVVGVVALGLLAAADALRRGGESKVVSEPPTTTRASRPTLRETLRREAVTGFVLYSDPDCRLHSLLLPTLADDVITKDNGAPLVQCRFELGGGRILKEGERISPDRQLVAACRGNHVEVWIEDSGRRLYSYRGCPPAWRPDDSLTYAQGDHVMSGDVVLFTARELRAAVRGHPAIADLSQRVRIFTHATDLAWLDEERLIVSLEVLVPDGPTMYPSVLFDGKAIVSYPSHFGSPLRNWVVSAAGSYVAADDGTIAARDGAVTTRPDTLPDGRAVAFSPDEQWLAYTTDVSIYLIGTPRNTEPGRIIQLPIAAKDLSWEPVGRGSLATSNGG